MTDTRMRASGDYPGRTYRQWGRGAALHGLLPPVQQRNRAGAAE